MSANTETTETQGERADAGRLSAIVLCGGRSERFGQDKALVRLAGRTLIERVIEAARPLTTDIVLATGAEPRYVELGWPVALDAPAAAPATGRLPGPLAGIAAGLAAVRGDAVFVLAVDLPLVTPAALRQLLEALGGHDAVIPESEGRRQPLCSLLKTVPARAAVARLLAADCAAPRDLADQLNAFRLTVGPPDGADPLARALFNVNSPEDLKRAELLLVGG